MTDVGSPYIKLALASVNHDEDRIPPNATTPEEMEKDGKMKMKRRIKNEPLSTKMKSGSCQEVVHTIQTTKIRSIRMGDISWMMVLYLSHLTICWLCSTAMIGSAILCKGSMTLT